MIIRSVREIVGDRECGRAAPGDTVRAACRTLDRLNVGALAVLEDGRLVGILSERDVIRKCVGRDRRTDETLVSEIMTPDPQTIDVGGSLCEALAAMKAGGFRHMPVTEGGRCVGMLSMREIPTDYRMMHERLREWREETLARASGG